MGVNKGQNNFARAQQQKIEDGKQAIKRVIAGIPKGTIFKKVNFLIAYTAAQTQMHRTTILRNPEYAVLIEEYFAAQPGAAGMVDERKANEAVLRAKIVNYKIRNKQLEDKLNSQERIIKKLLARQHNTFNGNNSMSDTLSAASAIRNDNLRTNETAPQLPVLDLAFINTAKALSELLHYVEKLEVGIVLDEAGQQIVDNNETGIQRVIVPKSILKEFLLWLQRNRSHNPADL